MNESVQKEAAAVISKAIEKLPSEALVASLALVTILVVAVTTHDGYNTTASAAFAAIIALGFIIFRYRLAVFLIKNKLDSKVEQGILDRLGWYSESLAGSIGDQVERGGGSGAAS